MGGRLRVAARLAISIGVLSVLAFVIVDPRDLGRTLVTVNPAAMLLAVILAAADRFVMAYKWRLLLRARGLPISLWTAVRSYWVSSLVGLILPVTLGADAFRIFVLRRIGVPDVTASIVVERILGAIAMGSVALASSALLVATVAGVQIQRFTLILVVVLVLAILVFVGSLFASSRWTVRLPAVASWLRRPVEAYGKYHRHPVVLSVFYVLSVSESLIVALMAFVVALGLGLNTPLYLLIATVPLAFAVARLPISLGGFGVQEAAFVYLAGLVGFPATEALSIMLLVDVAVLLALLPSLFDTAMLSFRNQALDEHTS